MNWITRVFYFAMACSCMMCNTNPKIKPILPTQKFQPQDPFKKNITPSQFFTIDTKRDTVVNSSEGTIIVIPKGCFKNNAGEIVETAVQIELTEALTIDEMILSNLTTLSNNHLLETDGMLYFNATANGQQLHIRKETPIHIEIPTKQKKEGMSVYKGVRDSAGNMNWIEPKPLVNYLIPIDQGLLNFLPEGFEAAVEKGIPFKNHIISTSTLNDSLYYSLSVSNGSENVKGFASLDLNEPYYNKQKKVANGKYKSSSFQNKPDNDTSPSLLIKGDSASCGIDPAIIKLIKSKKYEYSLLATREFESRLKVILKTCNQAVLEIYAKNTGKNLYELDSLASEALRNNQYYHTFHDFYQQKLTNVRQADKYAKLLKEYYEKELKSIRASLEEEKKRWVNQLDKKNAEAEKLVENYKQLLLKREKFRMETYGFEWTETGWINIDKGIIPKTWGPQRLEVMVHQASTFDRIYSYILYSTIKSLYRLNTDNNEKFYVGNGDEKEMLMPKRKEAFAVTIAYKKEQPFISVKAFETGTNRQLDITLEASTLGKIRDTLKLFDLATYENNISTDLGFMEQFFIERKRQSGLIKDAAFIRSLWQIAFSCCQAAPQKEELTTGK